VSLDTCRTRIDVNQKNSSGGVAGNRFKVVYMTLVHELGHALGIRNGSDGSGQRVHHPNYDLSLDSLMDPGTVICSPTPLDALAMYALYQTRS